MTTAYTSLLGLALPVTGELQGTWGDTVNNSITSLLDTAISGTTTLSTDADVTLTTTTGAANQARQAIILCSGARTAQRTITAPAQSKIYTIINATTGGYGVKLVGAGPTTGLTIPNGASAVVAWNGSDFIEIGSSTVGNLVVNGNLSVTGTTTLTGAATLTANPTLSAGTANGVAYLNGSKVLTTGSALTFDGTNFGIGLSASSPLEVQSNSGGTAIRIRGRATANTGTLRFYANDGTTQQAKVEVSDNTFEVGSITNVPFVFNQNGSEAMRLTSTGLGIGTSSPGTKLDVSGAASTNIDARFVARFADTSAVAANNGGGILFRGVYTGTTLVDAAGIQAYKVNATDGNYSYGLAFVTRTNGADLTTNMRLDSSGNLGLGVTPSAWQSGRKAMQVGNASINSFANSQNQLGANFYYDGTNNKYISSDFSTVYQQLSGQHQWYNAPSGTAGNAITFTQAMTLDASGNLQLGTTTPKTTLISGGGNGLTIGGATAPNLTVWDTTDASYATFLGQVDATSYLFNYANGALTFGTNNTERARIDSSGNLLVGTTSTINSAALTVKKAVNDNIALFDNSGGSSPYGIQSRFSGVDLNNTGSHYFEAWSAVNSVYRFYVRSNGGISNYQANDTNLSDRREKTNFAPAGEYLSKICAIPVQTFNYIDQNMEEDHGTTLGAVAQDVQAVAPELVSESNWGSKEEPKMRLSIYQTDLQYALMKCIQEQQAIIEQLKADVAALKGN